MKKTVIAATAVAVMAGGGYAAYDYTVPDAVTVVNSAGGMLTSPEFFAPQAKSVGPNTKRIKSVFGKGTNGNNKPHK